MALARPDASDAETAARLAPLAAADEVTVLDRGRIVQRDPHRDLVERRGPYRDLWEAERLPEHCSRYSAGVKIWCMIPRRWRPWYDALASSVLGSSLAR